MQIFLKERENSIFLNQQKLHIFIFIKNIVKSDLYHPAVYNMNTYNL